MLWDITICSGNFVTCVYPGREKEFIMAYYKEFQRLIPVQEAQPFAMDKKFAKGASYNTALVYHVASRSTIFLFVLRLLVRLACLCRIRKGGHVNML